MKTIIPPHLSKWILSQDLKWEVCQLSQLRNTVIRLFKLQDGLGFKYGPVLLNLAWQIYCIALSNKYSDIMPKEENT